VSFVAASVDDATQTVLVKAGVPAGAKDLRADQFVRVRVIWATEPGLTIPVVAVQRVNSQHFVFVAEEASGGLVARQRQVSLGPVLGDAYLAIAGVSAGDLIVLAGTQKIGEGAPIQALPPGGAPPSGAGPGPGGAGGD
jgi:multidrug efflux pump subunit AcrA (membrane-fusion protein)